MVDETESSIYDEIAWSNCVFTWKRENVLKMCSEDKFRYSMFHNRKIPGKWFFNRTTHAILVRVIFSMQIWGNLKWWYTRLFWPRRWSMRITKLLVQLLCISCLCSSNFQSIFPCSSKPTLCLSKKFIQMSKWDNMKCPYYKHWKSEWDLKS